MLPAQFETFVTIVGGAIVGLNRGNVEQVQHGVTALILSLGVPLAAVLLYNVWRPGTVEEALRVHVWRQRERIQWFKDALRNCESAFSEEHLRPLSSLVMDSSAINRVVMDSIDGGKELVLKLLPSMMDFLFLLEMVY